MFMATPARPVSVKLVWEFMVLIPDQPCLAQMHHDSTRVRECDNDTDGQCSDKVTMLGLGV